MSLALCLMALSVTGGCAHFREGAERARGQDDSAVRPVTRPAPTPAPEPAPAPPPRRAEPAPTPPPPPPAAVAPAPAPAPVAPAPEPAPAPAPDTSKADAAARKAEARDRKAQAAAEAKAQRAQDAQDKRAARNAEKTAPEPAAPVREPIPQNAPTVDRTPAPPPPPAAPVAEAAPGSASAIVTFASTPGTQCGACESLKISVSPGGKVLIERGHFTGSNTDWRYRRYTARVTPERAAAFSARLAAYRPQGRQLAACTAPAGSDSGVIVEWFEMGRHDQLNVSFACNAQIAEAMRSAPDLLGLKQLDFPWKSSR